MYYPKADMIKDKETLKLWFEKIGQADYKIVLRAVDEYALHSERKMFPPSIGEIYDGIKLEQKLEQFFEIQIRRFFDRAVGCYPNIVAENEDECLEAFMELVNEEEENAERINVAGNLYRLAVDVGKQIDEGKPHITFCDLMRGVANV